MPPPLWVARIAKLHRKVSKIEAWLLPLQVGHQGLGSKSPDIGQKMGRNLSEDLFFALHLIFGKKWDKIWVWRFQISNLCSSQIFWSFWPPPFQNPAYATGSRSWVWSLTKLFLFFFLVDIELCLCLSLVWKAIEFRFSRNTYKIARS